MHADVATRLEMCSAWGRTAQTHESPKQREEQMPSDLVDPPHVYLARACAPPCARTAWKMSLSTVRICMPMTHACCQSVHAKHLPGPSPMCSQKKHMYTAALNLCSPTHCKLGLLTWRLSTSTNRSRSVRLDSSGYIWFRNLMGSKSVAEGEGRVWMGAQSHSRAKRQQHRTPGLSKTSPFFFSCNSMGAPPREDSWERFVGALSRLGRSICNNKCYENARLLS